MSASLDQLDRMITGLLTYAQSTARNIAQPQSGLANRYNCTHL